MLLNALELQQPDGSVIGALATEQRGLPLLVFIHGNGFAGGIYSPMFEHLSSRFDVLAMDIPGHGRSEGMNPFIGWNEAAERLHNAARSSGLMNNRAVYGVGHSLGGALTLLSAFRHPGNYCGLVLLDPIIFPKRMLAMMRIVRTLGLTRRFHPHINATLRRRRQWDSRSDVIDYFRTRSVFRGWTEESLQSFAQYATKDTGNGVSLACDPELEAHFFGSLPAGLWRAIDGVECDTALIMGQSSYPFSRKAAQIAARNNPHIRQKSVPGSHCFMQENPVLAAAEVAHAIASFGQPDCG